MCASTQMSPAPTDPIDGTIGCTLFARRPVELDGRAVPCHPDDVLGGEPVTVQAQCICSTQRVQPVELTFLSGADVTRLAMADEEILAAVEGGLRAQGSGQARIEPRV